MEHIILVLVIVIAFLLAILVIRSFGGSTPRDPNDLGLTLIQNQINASIQQTTQNVEALRNSLDKSMQMLTEQMSRSLSETNKTMGDRLDSTAKVIGDVRQQLGQLDESSRHMAEIGKEISKLQDILQPPKLRGALGELFLAEILAHILPADHYKLQYQFKGGETVDAVIVLRLGLVPIDAKFPLENFKRILTATGEDSRKAAKKNFINDVKSHIDAIAGKYIRMDENTFDFALMYIPAENVYYETIIKDDEFGGEMSLFNYALKKRVVPVSPNSFYAYLQTIILGLKGMRVEEHSREILENLSRLEKEFNSFAEAFRLVGQHLDNSQKKYTEAQRRFDKLESNVERIDGLAKGLETDSTQTLPEPEQVIKKETN
ncbi:MAG: DNA recombination protein RmuC [Kiritimatiellae bacterium]|nr:DNA recombination protein RmuC [Kiritimatiellia bacterium]MDD5519181.1 DNA recombination protein RmuC [Kiritimatiellia bacterium]